MTMIFYYNNLPLPSLPFPLKRKWRVDLTHGAPSQDNTDLNTRDFPTDYRSPPHTLGSKRRNCVTCHSSVSISCLRIIQPTRWSLLALSHDHSLTGCVYTCV